MKSLKVLAVVLLAMFSFSTVNAQVVHHKRARNRMHHKRHHHVKRHAHRPVTKR